MVSSINSRIYILGKLYLTSLNKQMNRLAFLFLVVCAVSFGQQGTIRTARYHPHDMTDSFSVFMENENAKKPQPGEATYSITIAVTNIRNKKGVRTYTCPQFSLGSSSLNSKKMNLDIAFFVP